MIVARDPGGLLLVRQVDHQEQCGLMARAWGNADFARPDPFPPVAEAAALHDEGWRDWEGAPRQAEGAPVNFTDMDRAAHVSIYRECISAARRRDPRQGLLVSMHGQGLYEYTPPERREPLAREFIDEQRRVQDEIRRELGGGAPLDDWASRGYRLVRAWDALSLYLTWRGLREGRDGRLADVPRAAGGEGVDLRLSPAGAWAAIVEPWPFSAPRVDLPVRARRIPDRPYADDEDLRRALSAAPWLTLAYTVQPGSVRGARPDP